jgi:phosphoribosyl-ATP pyrophosphohydrolase/phosphoribosyl-AMP cyclohydrolase
MFTPLNLTYDPVTGLVPAIVQDADTAQVLMLGYLNEEALVRTRQEGRVTFFSRSKNRLWTKGETSGNFLTVVSLHADCDADAVLIRVRPAGPTCHRGSTSCFEAADGSPELEPPVAFLSLLERLIQQREAQPASNPESYTVALMRQGIAKVAQKVGEEAVETVIDAVAGRRDTLPGEVADLLYHLLVLLVVIDLPLNEVIDVLRSRHIKKPVEREYSSRTTDLT